MIVCDMCGNRFDPIGRRWLCPCGYKMPCCDGAPQPYIPKDMIESSVVGVESTCRRAEFGEREKG